MAMLAEEGEFPLGTLTGIGRFFRRSAPEVEMVLADPQGSVLAELVRTGKSVEAGSWLVEGIGEDFVPPICDLSLVSQVITVSDAESFHTARELLRLEGLLAGSSSGTLVHAALAYCRAQSVPKRVVTFICDSGSKYLSKMFNDYWMIDQGFIERERFGDIRDLISRRAEEGAVVAVAPDDTLNTAYGRMRLYDISQLRCSTASRSSASSTSPICWSPSTSMRSGSRPRCATS